MARRGPQYELLHLLLQAGEHGDVPEERLEQLYQEVAPQVRPPTTRARALRASRLKPSDASLPRADPRRTGDRKPAEPSELPSHGYAPRVV